jgi:hypothetical protein
LFVFSNIEDEDNDGTTTKGVVLLVVLTLIVQ